MTNSSRVTNRRSLVDIFFVVSGGGLAQHSPRQPRAATPAGYRGRRALEQRIFVALEVLENGMERGAGGAPPQVAAIAVVAAPYHRRVVDGGEPLRLPAFEVRRQEGPLLHQQREAHTHSISAWK